MGEPKDTLPREQAEFSASNCSAQLKLIKVEPQPDWIESSGRWHWPLPDSARFPGCCTFVCTASREWWEYVPSEGKPHPMAEGVRLRDAWYWAVPNRGIGPNPQAKD